jgi:hypothetical protein
MPEKAQDAPGSIYWNGSNGSLYIKLYGDVWETYHYDYDEQSYRQSVSFDGVDLNGFKYIGNVFILKKTKITKEIKGINLTAVAVLELKTFLNRNRNKMDIENLKETIKNALFTIEYLDGKMGSFKQ